MKYLFLGIFIVVVVSALSGEVIDRVSKPVESLAPCRGTFSERPTLSFSTFPHDQLSGRGQAGRNDGAEVMDSLLWRLLAPLLLGGVGATIFNIYWSYRSRKREAAGLILVLTAEFVAAFSRCATYYEQLPKEETSYSSLFVLSDASFLSKFATLVRKADLVMAAITLKTYFFQIERHAEAASRGIMEAIAAEGTPQGLQILKRVRAEKDATVGFFMSPYDGIVQNLRLLINASLKIEKGSVGRDLQKKFEDAIKKKEAVDFLLRTLAKQGGSETTTNK